MIIIVGIICDPLQQSLSHVAPVGRFQVLSINEFKLHGRNYDLDGKLSLLNILHLIQTLSKSVASKYTEF